MILSLTLFALGITLYSIHELAAHGKLKWMTETYGGSLPRFWSSDSWMRKYKKDKAVLDAYDFEEAPKNWYYKLFDIKYKERFPLSATALVCITDGMHLMQFFYIKLFILSIVLYDSVFTWWIDGAIYLGIYYAVFNVIYKAFSK